MKCWCTFYWYMVRQLVMAKSLMYRSVQHIPHQYSSVLFFARNFQSMITFTTRNTLVLPRLYLAHLVYSVLEQTIFWSLEKWCIMYLKHNNTQNFPSSSNYCIPRGHHIDSKNTSGWCTTSIFCGYFSTISSHIYI